MKSHEFKAARKAKGLSQRELASLLGVSFSAVTKWETAKNPVPAWVAEKLTEKAGQFTLTGLNPEEVMKLERLAASKGVTPESLMADLIKAAI